MATASAERQWKPRVNPWVIAATVALASFMEVLDTSIANVALLPSIERHRSSHGCLGIQRYRAQAFFSPVHHRLYGFELPLRHLGLTSDAVDLPHFTGCWRRGPATNGAGYHG